MNVEVVTTIVFGIWLLLLSFVLFWILFKFRKLTKQVNKGNLIKVLDKVLETEVENSKNIKQLKKGIEGLELEGLKHVQKVGYVRFNPFDEMGGDHSFVLCLLNGKDDGLIFTGLHARERTRVYLKQISKGKCKYDLSKEELKALNKALKER